MQQSGIPLENLMGINFYSTDTPGTGGRLREHFEAFVVSEVPVKKVLWENGEYTHFTLEKTNYDTLRAISVLSRALGVSRKRFGFAGTKDRRAVTRQRMAVWRVSPERLKALDLKDLRLSDFKKSCDRLLVGDLIGNDFQITLRDAELADEASIRECLSQMQTRGVPNYFGYQRFGVMRPNTHVIGRQMVKDDIEGAVMSYLADYYDAERDDAREARRELKETGDFKAALQNFPKRLGYERTMLDHLYKHPTDYAGALRKLHKKLRQMFVHGYQSYLFNLILSGLIEREVALKDVEIPLFGFESTFSDGVQGEIEREVLGAEETTPADFRLPALPELGSRGAMRQAVLLPDVEYRCNDDGSITFSFFLSKGNYATMVMREIMKTEPVNY